MASAADDTSGNDAPLAASDATGSASDRVTEAIIQGIRAGTFVPGQHLLEPDLTRRLGISRGSLREALKHLSAAGIVTLSRFRGAYISRLDRKSVLDLLDTLEPLARLAARLAAQHCETADQIARLREVVAQIGSAAADHNRSRYLEQRRSFYTVLVDIGGNRELARTMPLTRTDLFRAQIEMIQSEKQRQRHAAGYTKIVKAVIDRDPAAAERAVSRHFAGTRETMAELPENAFPTLDQ